MAKPQRIASMMSAQIEPLPPTASLVSTAGVSVCAPAASMAAADAGAPSTVIVSSSSVRGMQLESSQIIHSTVAFTVASGLGQQDVLREPCRAFERADLHLVDVVVVAVGSGELLHLAGQAGARLGSAKVMTVALGPISS